jgi:hypothetical protein
MREKLRQYRIWLTSADLRSSTVKAFLESGVWYPFKKLPTPGLIDKVFGKHFAGVSPADAPEVMADDRNQGRVADALATVNANVPYPSQGLHQDGISTTSGHFTVQCMDVRMPKEGRNLVADLRLPILGSFAAFPNGIVPIPESLGPDYLKADNKAKFLKDNEGAIEVFGREIFDITRSPQSLRGAYVILGNGSLVRVMQHYRQVYPDGSAMTVWHPQTTSRHNFDGSYIWAFHTSVDRPDTIRCIGLQAGKHPLTYSDSLNVSAGGVLFWHNSSAAPDFLDAFARGDRVRTGDTGLIRDPQVRLTNRLLASADHFGSPIARHLRERYGPNTRSETVILAGRDLPGASVPPEEFERRDDFPVIDPAEDPVGGEPGVLVDGRLVPLHESAFGASAGLPGADRVIDEVNSLTEYTKSDAAATRIRDKVIAFAERQFGADWKTFSRSELMTKLVSEPELRFHMESIVEREIYDPIADQLADTIGAIDATPEIIRQMEAMSREWVRSDVTVPLLTSDGALRSAIELHILDAQGKALDRAEVADRMHAAAKAMAAESAAIEWLQRTVPKDEQERHFIERKISEHRAKEQEATREHERRTEQVHDLDHHDVLRRQHEEAERRHREKVFRERHE